MLNAFGFSIHFDVSLTKKASKALYYYTNEALPQTDEPFGLGIWP
jgi:hypothetical protein